MLDKRPQNANKEPIYSATGRYPCLYTGSVFVRTVLEKAGIIHSSETILSKCWLWIAEYADMPILPKQWSSWTLWQYTNGTQGPHPHTITGIDPCIGNSLMAHKRS